MTEVRKSDRWAQLYASEVELFLKTLASAEEQGVQYDKENFSQALKSGLRLLDISDAEFAQEIDASRSAVSRWASGKAIPPMIARKKTISHLKSRFAGILKPQL